MSKPNTVAFIMRVRSRSGRIHKGNYQQTRANANFAEVRTGQNGNRKMQYQSVIGRQTLGMTGKDGEIPIEKQRIQVVSKEYR